MTHLGWYKYYQVSAASIDVFFKQTSYWYIHQVDLVFFLEYRENSPLAIFKFANL